MQQIKGIRELERLKKKFTNIKIEFMKRGTSVTRFCEQNGINRRHVHRAFLGGWNTETAKALRQRLIDASKGKTDFLTTGRHNNERKINQ